MVNERVVLNANLGRTNIVDWEQFHTIAVDTLQGIIDIIMPLCGKDAMCDLVIHASLANDYARNVFSNDGIHILKSVEYMSPIQTYITNYIRYIAERVELASADGTSTAIYLAANLLIAALDDVDYIRIKCDTPTDQVVGIAMMMTKIKQLSSDIRIKLSDIVVALSKCVLKVDELDKDTRCRIIHQLAYTTSKGNDLLSSFAVELYANLPEVLYESSKYKTAEVETEDTFMIEGPEGDAILRVMPSANTIYNSKLNTELFYESCDLLICPVAYNRVDTLIQYLNKRKEAGNTTPLVILINAIDEQENVRLEIAVNRFTTTICRHVTDSPLFANNPLELQILQTMCDIDLSEMTSVDQFEHAIVHDLKLRLYKNELMLYDLFDHSTSPLHPNYVRGKNEYYDMIRHDLEERITTLRTAHNRKSVSSEISQFLRLYRLMICSRLPMLIIGGPVVDHIANINVAEDVLGVVSVAMKHGVVIDLMPKLLTVVKMLPTPHSRWHTEFVATISDFIALTYQALVTDPLPEDIIPDSVFVANRWMPLSEVDNNRLLIVQSYRTITETFNRLIETIPRLISTDKIIVPGSVMDNKKVNGNG